MKKDFEILEHAADVGIIARGATLDETFANAARALFSIIANLDNVDEVFHHDIELEAPDPESLLIAWLNELIYTFDTENILFKRFDISKLTRTRIKARTYGEKIDKPRHEIKTGVKAATYHMLKIAKQNGWQAQVLFDI
jgi:SHS2 domain-containing protein